MSNFPIGSVTISCTWGIMSACLQDLFQFRTSNFHGFVLNFFWWPSTLPGTMSYPVKTTSVLKTKTIHKEFQRNLVTLKKSTCSPRKLASMPCRHRRSPTIWLKTLQLIFCNHEQFSEAVLNEVGEPYVTDSFLRVALTLFTTRSRILLEKKDQCYREQRWKFNNDRPHAFGVLEQASRTTLRLFSPSISAPYLARTIISMWWKLFLLQIWQKDISTPDLVRTNSRWVGKEG